MYYKKFILNINLSSLQRREIFWRELFIYSPLSFNEYILFYYYVRSDIIALSNFFLFFQIDLPYLVLPSAVELQLLWCFSCLHLYTNRI